MFVWSLIALLVTANVCLGFIAYVLGKRSPYDVGPSWMEGGFAAVSLGIVGSIAFEASIVLGAIVFLVLLLIYFAELCWKHHGLPPSPMRPLNRSRAQDNTF